MSPMKRSIISYVETYKQINDRLIWKSYNENEEIKNKVWIHLPHKT
jgi:hypothetical protein